MVKLSSVRTKLIHIEVSCWLEQNQGHTSLK